MKSAAHITKKAIECQTPVSYFQFLLRLPGHATMRIRAITRAQRMSQKKRKKKQFPNRNKQTLKLKVFQNALALLFKIPPFFFFIIDFY